MSDRKAGSNYDQIINNLDDSIAPNCMFWGFSTDDAKPGPSHEAFIRGPLLTKLRSIPGTSTAGIAINGTCSFTGSKAHNMALGQRRADAIYTLCQAAGYSALGNVFFDQPASHGFEAAERAAQRPLLPPWVREEQGAIYRAVDFDILIHPGKVKPPPRPIKLHYFQMRTIYAVSLSPPIPIIPGVSVGFDRMHFEIRDLNTWECAIYSYSGFALSLGIPLDKLEKAVQLGRLTKIVLQIPGVASGGFAGPWNDFTHGNGPRFYKDVDKWWGAANYFSVGAFNAQGLPSWINFGGYNTRPPPTWSARIDPYDAGATIGFPQVNSGEGSLTLVAGPQKCTG
jgi:hypothetical protein